MGSPIHPAPKGDFMDSTHVAEKPDSENMEETAKTASEHHARGTYSSDARLRKFASWAAVLGAMAMVAYFGIFMMLQTLRPGDPENS
jgi:hypothetical protein